MLEESSPTRQIIEGRTGGQFISVGTQGVGPQGIDGDQDHTPRGAEIGVL